MNSERKLNCEMDISMKKMGWEVKSFEKITWITPQ